MAVSQQKAFERENWRQNETWRPSIRYSPDPREGYLSVVLKLAEENFIFDGASLQFLFRIKKVFDWDSRLKWRLRMDENEYLSFTLDHRACPPRTHYKGKSFHGSPFCVHRPRYCPYCLARAGILLAHWDIYLTTACDIHHCYLLDQCPKCHKPGVIENRMSVTHCSCGHDLRDAITTQADEANIKISTLVALAFGTSLNVPQNTSSRRFFPPFTHAIHFDDLLMSMEGLMGRWRYWGQNLHETAEQVSEAMRVFTPMIRVPKPEELEWKWGL